VLFATFDIAACKAPRDTKEKLVRSIVSILQLHSSQSTTAVPNRLDIHILRPHTQAHCSLHQRVRQGHSLVQKQGQEEKNISRSNTPSLQATLRRLSHNWKSLLVLNSQVSTTKPPDSRSYSKRLLTTRPYSFSRGFTQRGKYNTALGRTTARG
jgi:hypothetical protein